MASQSSPPEPPYAQPEASSQHLYPGQNQGHPQGPPPNHYGSGSIIPQQGQKYGVADAFVPTNPLAAMSCWLGIFGLLLCGFGAVLGPIAIVLGVISLKKGKIIEESSYGQATSKVRSYIGIVTGVLGTCVSVALIASRFIVR
jgi:hypothetical protein